jgi:hypothetical protein
MLNKKQIITVETTTTVEESTKAPVVVNVNNGFNSIIVINDEEPAIEVENYYLFNYIYLDRTHL